MKKYFVFILPVLIGLGFVAYGKINNEIKPEPTTLKIVFIRHGEKPEKGGNLTCKGLNRSLLIPAMIKSKFGVPDFLYAPTLKMAEKTGHARMFETLVPLAAKYNLDINTKYAEDDSAGISADMLQKKGTVLVAWEHKAISGILHSLGIQTPPKWGGDDYETILIITFPNGKATLATDKEGLNPAEDCP